MRTGTILPDGTVKREYLRGGGDVYKDDEAFETGRGVCYVPTMSDTMYTRDDLRKIFDSCPRQRMLREKYKLDLFPRFFQQLGWMDPEILLLEYEDK